DQRCTVEDRRRGDHSVRRIHGDLFIQVGCRHRDVRRQRKEIDARQLERLAKLEVYPLRRTRFSPTRRVTFSRSKYSERGMTNFLLWPTSSLKDCVVISLCSLR